MRYHFALILCLLSLIVLSSCQRASSTQVVGGTSLPPIAPTAFHEGTPVSDPEQAVIAALFGVKATRLEALAPPQTQVIEQLAHRAALDRVGHGSDAENSAYPDDLDVWLVVFEGEWSIPPPMSTALPPFHGCVFAILTAAQSQSINVGTCSCSVCNPFVTKTSLPIFSSRPASSPQAPDAMTNTVVPQETRVLTPLATLDASM